MKQFTYTITDPVGIHSYDFDAGERRAQRCCGVLSMGKLNVYAMCSQK